MPQIVLTAYSAVATVLVASCAPQGALNAITMQSRTPRGWSPSDANTIPYETNLRICESWFDSSKTDLMTSLKQCWVD